MRRLDLSASASQVRGLIQSQLIQDLPQPLQLSAIPCKKTRLT